MNFLTPAFAVFGLLAGPIIILYMLRLRRREVQISSTMLWQRIVQDREANAPWQKLRRNLLLLLQLLILTALVIALMRPFLPVPSVASGSVAVLLDASGSMNATDMGGGQTRFDAAKDEARTLVGELASNEVMTVISVGPAPRVLTPPTNDRAALREAINSAEPTQSLADWEAAISLAAASIAGREQSTIVILSDGGLPTDIPPMPGDVRYVRIGRQQENVAISALAVRSLDGIPQLFAAVTNYGAQDTEVILGIEVDGDLVTAESLAVAAGETVDLTLADLPASVNLIRAELSSPVGQSTQDYLSLDDVASAINSPPVSGEALLVTEGNLFLEQLLTSLPGLDVFKTDPGELPARTFDLVIFDGYLPDQLPDTNLLVINPDSSTDYFSVGDYFSETRYLRQIDDPILTFVDFPNIAIREARQVQAAGWAQTLVEAEGGPLLLAGTVEGRRIAIIPFDLHASDLPLRVDFPILMANLLQWYSPSRAFDAAGGLSPGDPLVIRPRPLTTQYRITLPDGSIERFPSSADTLTFTRTDQVGIYRVELLNGLDVQVDEDFAVNLFSEAESQITPQDAILIGGAVVSRAGSGDDFGQRELWRWLAVIALIVLALEWWVFHRGSVITQRERQERGREREQRPGVLFSGRKN